MDGFLEIALDFKNKFDIVLLLFTSFGYFSDEENFRVLKNVYAALKPSGHFVLDVPNTEFL